MEQESVIKNLRKVLKNMPNDWLNLTTHRLDIYDESQAKTQFLENFEELIEKNKLHASALNNLPTAFDYIRLGHPLSCVLEWSIARLNNLTADSLISFGSKMAPILAILRKNLFEQKNTRILYKNSLPIFFNSEKLTKVYGYLFTLQKIDKTDTINAFEGSTILLSQQNKLSDFEVNSNIDFILNIHDDLGSILIVNGQQNEHYISEIQHVRRRETIAMTPINSFRGLQAIIGEQIKQVDSRQKASNKERVLASIKEITETRINPVVASSGLSIQYAILMGLIDHAFEEHKGKKIKIIVPPNCYGGTNDQARRVAACIEGVEITDLLVDGGNDMVQSIEQVLEQTAKEDAVPYIIAEIPTNPRVEVPDLIELKAALSKVRKTKNGTHAVEPVFILDQTFCPNIHFLGDGEILSSVRALSYASGSKFPSGGKCTAGYCVANQKAEPLMQKITQHLTICDNEATALQYEILAAQLPSMNTRIHDAYINTREFVNFIKETLPEAKINFVSEELAEKGFTPSVFSLDLPTKGNTDEEREANKRILNHKLIGLMINEIPNESKYCVSYGQLKGCYWTIPATSTQGTTKEGDKDYIARVALSADMDLNKHKEVFASFVKNI
ncbi:MAG: cystathionine beta-synthase [Crocinitomicaceae bacterium]